MVHVFSRRRDTQVHERSVTETCGEKQPKTDNVHRDQDTHTHLTYYISKFIYTDTKTFYYKFHEKKITRVIYLSLT